MQHPQSRRLIHAGIKAHTGRAFDPIRHLPPIENALAESLVFIRKPGDTPEEIRAHLWAALGRTRRALALLKWAAANAYSVEGQR